MSDFFRSLSKRARYNFVTQVATTLYGFTKGNFVTQMPSLKRKTKPTHYGGKE